jgi:hypothetical protein
MVNDSSQQQPADLTRISFTEKWEVAFWEQELGAKEIRLRQVIALIGNQTNQVREHLKRTRVRFPQKPNH